MSFCLFMEEIPHSSWSPRWIWILWATQGISHFASHFGSLLFIRAKCQISVRLDVGLAGDLKVKPPDWLVTCTCLTCSQLWLKVETAAPLWRLCVCSHVLNHSDLGCCDLWSAASGDKLLLSSNEPAWFNTTDKCFPLLWYSSNCKYSPPTTLLTVLYSEVDLQYDLNIVLRWMFVHRVSVWVCVCVTLLKARQSLSWSLSLTSKSYSALPWGGVWLSGRSNWM